MQKIRPDLDIGRNIQNQRRKSGLTQEDVVAQLDVMGLTLTRSTYAKIESSSYNIRVSELVALKHIFKMSSFDEFFAGLE